MNMPQGSETPSERLRHSWKTGEKAGEQAGGQEGGHRGGHVHPYVHPRDKEIKGVENTTLEGY